MAARKPAPIQLNKKTGRPVAPPPPPLPVNKKTGRPVAPPPPPLPVNKKTGRPIPPPRPPIDMVRNPGFGSAMANQNYQNALAGLRAKMDAERGGVGAVIDRLPTLAGSILNPETLNKAKEEYMNQNPGDPNRRVKADLIKSRYLGQIGRTMAGFDKWFETNYINNPNSSLSEQERMTLNPRMGAPTNQPRPSSPQRDPNTGMTFQEMMARQNQPLPPEQAPFTPRPQLPQEVRDAIERRNAAQNQFTQGRLMGAPTEQPNPNAGKPAYFQALEGELQKQFLDKNPQLKPKPGTAPNPQLMQENYAKFLQNQMSEVNKFNAANPQYAQDIRRPNPEFARQSEQSFLEGLLDYSKVSPSQVNVLNQLKSSYLNEGQGGATRPPIPQNPQMATYNNLLQQGIQRSNTMNQDAATNFANLQAGAPTTQPTIPLPQLGGVTAQPRNLPRPRQPKGFGSPIGRSAF